MNVISIQLSIYLSTSATTRNAKELMDESISRRRVKKWWKLWKLSIGPSARKVLPLGATGRRRMPTRSSRIAVASLAFWLLYLIAYNVFSTLPGIIGLSFGLVSAPPGAPQPYHESNTRCCLQITLTRRGAFDPTSREYLRTEEVRPMSNGTHFTWASYPCPALASWTSVLLLFHYRYRHSSSWAFLVDSLFMKSLVMYTHASCLGQSHNPDYRTTSDENSFLLPLSFFCSWFPSMKFLHSSFTTNFSIWTLHDKYIQVVTKRMQFWDFAFNFWILCLACSRVRKIRIFRKTTEKLRNKWKQVSTIKHFRTSQTDFANSQNEGRICTCKSKVFQLVLRKMCLA